MSIDYRDIARKFSYAQHAARADQYFSKITIDSSVARKPFASIDEATEILSGLGVLLPNLNLFKGVRVLDFGAGTCWLSRELAKLGASVTAADVSDRALALGQQLIANDPVSASLDVEFVRLIEGRLPFADGSFDRIVCFDAFHHVPDQELAIREFARVLRNGGLAAFHEPGPHHSQAVQSQYEMRTFGVIESDIRVEELAGVARSAGFTKIELAAYTSHPALISLDQFNDLLSSAEEASAWT